MTSPDKKYIAVDRNSGDTFRFNAEDWAASQKEFMTDFPDAEIVEYDAYKPENLQDNDTIFVDTEDGQFSFTPEEWKESEEEFRKDFKTVNPMIARGYDYHYNAAKEIEGNMESQGSKIAEWEQKRQDFLNTLSNEDTAKINQLDIQKMSGVQGMEFGGNDPIVSQYNALMTEGDELKAEQARLEGLYGENPRVQAAREEWAKEYAQYKEESINRTRDEIAKAKAENVDLKSAAQAKIAKAQSISMTGALSAQTDLKGLAELQKLERLESANYFLDMAEDAKEGNMNGFWKGFGDVGSAFVESIKNRGDIANYADLFNIMKKLEEKVGNLKNITDEDIDSNLSESERLLLKSYFEYADALENANPNWQYKAGQIGAQGIKIAIEFALSAGAAGAVSSAATKGLTEGIERWAMNAIGKGANKWLVKAAEKTAIGATRGALNVVLQTALRPSTYAQMAQKATEIDEYGHLNGAKNSAISFIDSTIETISEMSGEAITKLIGLIPMKGIKGFAGKAFNNTIGKTGFGQWGKAVIKGSFGDYLRVAGFHGVPVEMLEEVVGSALRELTIDDKAFEESFGGDNKYAMAVGFLPLTFLGAGFSVAGLAAAQTRAKNASSELATTLEKYGFQKGRVESLSDFNTETNPVESSLMAREVISELKRKGASQEDIDKVNDFVESRAEYQTMRGAKNAQEVEEVQSVIAELDSQYKGYNREGNVTIAVLNDGRRVFITSERTPEGEYSAIDQTTGEGIVINESDIIPIDGAVENVKVEDYAKRVIDSRIATAEANRMISERNAQISELSRLLPKEINLGTTGEPNMVVVKGQDGKGVTVVDAEGNEAVLSWDEVGIKMGAPIKVLTDAQIAEAEAAEIGLSRAERRAQRARTAEQAQSVENEVNAITQEVKDVTPAPEEAYTNPETGVVDEDAFWENDPEGFCDWNDRLNQDGGVDSVEQIESSLAKLQSKMQETRKLATDSPNARKAVKEQVKNLQEKIDRLVSLQQKYVEQAVTDEQREQERADLLIQMRERVNQWRQLFGLTEEELVAYEALDEVTSASAREQIARAKTEGWYNGKKAFLFLPDISSMEELDKKVMHEVVTHFGLDRVMTQEQKNTLLDKVWSMMSDSARRAYLSYPGVSNLNGIEKQRAAANEFMAKVAESVSMNKATAEQKSLWQKIVDFFNELFKKVNAFFGAVDVAEMVRDNYRMLVSQAAAELAPVATEEVPVVAETAPIQPEASQAEVDTQVEQILNESGISLMEDAPIESMTNIVDAATQEPAAIDFAPEADNFLFSTKTENYLAERIRGYATTKEGKKAGWTPQMVEDIIAETQALITAIHNASTGNEFYDEFAAKDPTIKLDWRDGQLKPTVTWTRGNIEYKYDMSADLLCVNNEGLEEVLSSEKMVALMELFNMSKKDEITTKTLDGKEKTKKVEIGFSQDDYLELYNTLKDLGFVVPCKGCFDAAGRFKMLPSVAYKFAAAVNAVIDERNADPEAFDAALKSKVKKNAATNGLPTSAKTKLDAIRAGVAGDNLTEHVKWTQLMSADGQTKMLSDWGGIFRAWQRTGAGRPKDKLLPEPYYGDIVSSHTTIIGAYGDKTPSFRDIDVNQGTGLRRNSHSEFRPVLAVDEIQFMRDAYIKGLTVFKYMKELDDVRLFGKMGVKFNMSFFPEFVPGTKAAGLDKDGNYIPSEESVGAREFPYTGEDGKVHYDGMKGWQEAQKHINKDVSLSSVILSIPHLIKALTDVPTTFDKSGIWGSLIPFHSSGATSLALFLQGLGRARANGVGHGFEEAFTRYDEGVTNFEAVQNDRFGKGWVIVEGKEDKVGTAVEEGHKLEFVNGKHYYNSEMGLHLFASMYIFDSELPEGALNEDGTINLSAKELKKIAHKYEIDYNNKVREIGTPTAYAEAADYYLDLLPKLGLKPRFDFDVPEDVFLQMCEDAKVDPTHPKLGWKGKGHAWNPIHSAAYYSLFCDYGMTDPATGEWAPHNPVGYVNENGEREFRMPENTVQIVKEGLDRYSGIRRSESAKIDEAINEFAKRSVEKGRISKEAAESVLGEGLLFSTNEKAPETAVQQEAGHSTVVSSADGANILNNLKNLAEEYKNKTSNRQKTFIGDLARALGLRNNGNHSNYGTFEAVNGIEFTYRVSDHNASTKNMEDADKMDGISLVITHKPNAGINNDGAARIVEIYYNTQKLLKADGHPYAQIIESVMQSLYSGEYKDTTGLAESESANLYSTRTDEDRAKLFDAAMQKYGVTNNFNAAGYMLPDGSLLDFSEANDGGDPNRRSLDHRDIEGIIMDEGREYDSRHLYIVDFMNEGAIRMMPESNGVNLSVAPSEEQRKRLIDYFYKKNGYVIVEIADENGGSAAYVEYDKGTSPYRIMRDIDGYFNEGIVPQQSGLMFSTSNNNQAIFVSNAAKAVEGIKQEKATPEQWLKMIEKNGGLKAGEDKWMGLSDFLKASDKKTLTKQEVLDFVNEHMIVIEEQHYSINAEDDAERAHGEISERLQDKFDNFVDEYYQDHDWDGETEDARAYAIEKLREEMGDTFPYTIELEYGNVYLTFPYEEEDDLVKWAEKTGVKYTPGVSPINDTRLNYTTDGLENKHEIALTVPTIVPWNDGDEIHFGDAGDGRAVAWIRFGETKKLLGTTEVEGKKKFNWAKVLVIDEIQSKRHQEGREKGYRVSDIEQWLSDNNVEVVESGEFYEFIKNGETDRRFSKGLMNYDIEKAKRLYVSGYNKSDIPDAPFDKNWHELAMKRMLRYAAENGYDVIAWTKGDQQADRYNLGKIYNEIEREDNPNIEGRTFSFSGGNYDKVTVNEDGVVVDSTIEEAKGKSLSDLVGKDLAVKMMSLENYDTIDEEDLRIGGEGMKGFYDKMLPAFMNKYGKKWGIKVEDIHLNLEGGLDMHSVPVTDEMKESVMEGQVMFSTKGTDESAKDFIQSATDSFYSRYNTVAPASVVYANSRKMVAEGLGISVDDLTDEAYKFIREQAKRSGALFVPMEVVKEDGTIENRNRILIFAKDNVNMSAKVDRSLFHENTHGIVLEMPELLDLGQWLLGSDERITSAIAADIKNQYDEEDWAEEMICDYVGVMLSLGRGQEALDNVTDEYKPLLNSVYERFGYKPEDEDPRRSSERNRDARELQMRNSENGENRDKGKELFSTAVTPEVRREMDIISAQAIVNGNYLKAPNGKDTKLTPEQWSLVRTQNFKNWFGDWENDPENASKVVDENGEPMVVYHGTAGVINKFEDQQRSPGFWFVDREDVANGYAESASAEFGEEKNIIPVFLNIRNPRVEDAHSEYPAEFALKSYVENDNGVYEVFETYDEAEAYRQTNVPDGWVGAAEVGDQHDLVERAKELGHDGVIMLNMHDQATYAETRVEGTQTNYVVLDANQIKSATENNGEFSESEDIRFSTNTIDISNASLKEGIIKLNGLDRFNLTKAFKGIKDGLGTLKYFKVTIQDVPNDSPIAYNIDFRDSLEGHATIYVPETMIMDGNRINPKDIESELWKILRGAKRYQEYEYGKQGEYSFDWLAEEDAQNESATLFSTRTKPAPTKTQDVYKLMRLGADGKLYPLFIGSAEPIELGTWYDAESPNLGDLTKLASGVHLVNNENGEAMTLEEFKGQHPEIAIKGKRPNVAAINWATENGARWIEIEDKATAQRRYEGESRSYYNLGINGSGQVGQFAMRPGWHAGSLPTMRQIGKGKDKNLRDDSFVWVKGRIPADVDYQSEADANPDKDIPTHIPTDGFYMKATNANKRASQADKMGWYVAGSFIADEIMSDAEARSVIDSWNAEHPDAQVEFDYPRESGREYDPKRGGLVEKADILFSTSNDKSVDEIVSEGKQKVATENREAADAFMNRIRRINGNLQKLRMAAAAQREYDQKTVKTITDVANDLLEGGALSDMTKGEIKRLLSIINGGVGKSDLTISINRLMDLMVANQLRYGKNLIDKFLKIRGSKVDQRGVEVRGTLDIPGQQMLTAFKEGIGLSKEKLADRIADAEDALASDSETKKRNAENELVGLYLAKQYHEDINDGIEEEKDLRNEMKLAHDDYKAGIITREIYVQLLDSINEAILDNRIQRVNAYEKLASDLGAKMVSSIKNAGLLRDAEKERVQKIQHFANSDLQGKPASAHEVKESKFWNNPLVSLVTSPLVTFEQWLRVFGEKSAEGKGYLWNYFMTKWNDANNNEYQGMRDAHMILDSMVRSMFGSDFDRWSDLFSIEKNMPTIPIKIWDDGEMVDKELSQGNALYIYMVNKMVDGKMKLRKMGISQEDVDAIVAQMDPRFITLADWMQETFLPSLRDKYNAVHERLFGAPMAAIDNYFPIKVLANARVREVDVEAGEGSAKPATITGSIIKRTKNSLALDVLGSDAFDVLLEHVQQMEHWAAFAEFNKDLNTLLSYKKFRNRVQNMSGTMGAGLDAWKSFKESAEIAAGVYKPKTGKADKAITNIVKGLTAGKISFRLWTAMKQILSMPAFAPYTNLSTFGKNLAAPMSAFNWAMENLPAFEKRWKSREAGNVRLKKTEVDIKVADWMEAITRAGMTPNAFVDAVTCAIGAKSVYETKYNQYIKDGYTEDQADEKAKLDATVAFNATQQSSEAAFLSAIQIDRTFVSHAFTVFRNNSFGMQRELVDAVRNMRHRMSEGYKEQSIEFMKKQMIRDGLTEDHADRAAKRIYRNGVFKDAARIATFGFMMQFLWALGGSAIYMLFGDDDEDKRKMIKEAAIRGAFGSVEGLGGGNFVADALSALATGEFDRYKASFAPAISDIESLVDEMKRDVVAGASDLVNLLVQMGIGVNPQILADAALAIYDACDGDLETSKEVGILILRMLQAPQSNIDKLFTDEIDFTKDKGLDLTIEEFAQRYADYKARRNAPYSFWIYDDEQEKKQEQKYIKRFLKDAEELKRSRGNEEAKKYYEYLDTDYKETTETINELRRKAKESAMKGEQVEALEFAKMLDDFMKTDLFQEYIKFGGKTKAIETIRDKAKKVDLQTRESLEDMMLELRKELVEEMEKANN